MIEIDINISQVFRYLINFKKVKNKNLKVVLIKAVKVFLQD